MLEEAARIKEIAQAGRNQLAGVLQARRHLHDRSLPAAGPHPGAARAARRRCRSISTRISPSTWRPRCGRGASTSRSSRCRSRRRAWSPNSSTRSRSAWSSRRATNGRSASRSARTSSPAEQPILLDIGHCFRDQVLDACPELNRADAHVARTSSLETVRNMVASGLGVSVLPRDALTPQISQPAGRADSVHAAGAVAARRARPSQEFSAARSHQGDARRQSPRADPPRWPAVRALKIITEEETHDLGSQGQGRAHHRRVDRHRRRGRAGLRREGCKVASITTRAAMPRETVAADIKAAGGAGDARSGRRHGRGRREAHRRARPSRRSAASTC